MAERLTDKMVKASAAPAAGSKIIYDDDVKGFGLRVTYAGARAFVLNYRAGGRERRITIGSYPDWTTAAAREEAKALKRRIDQGGDPMGERHELRAAPTVTDLAQLYRDVHLPRKRPRSQQEDEGMLRRLVIPALGRTRVTDVRRSDVAAFHREVTKTAPVVANRALALLSKMFAVAIHDEWLKDNPCRGIERNPENRRERFMNELEIAKLAEVLAVHPERMSANAIRILLLTGARKGETLAARWEAFDLDKGVWTKPGASTKQKTSHRVPLSAPAMALLQEMRAAADPRCPFVFPGGDGKPLTDIKNLWASVCRRAGLSGVRIHDLRHTYASILVSSGLSLPVIGRLLGHTQATTTNRYAHLMDDPLRAATELVGVVVGGSGLKPSRPPGGKGQ